MKVPGIDVYVTYRCNLRCRHCFVGSLLDLQQHMSWPDLRALVEQAGQLWGTQEISFLGGEPTLYPHIRPAIELAHTHGYRVRVVSNAGAPARRLINRLDRAAPTHFAFSLDGSSAQQHDAVRRRGSFDQVARAVSLAQDAGFSTSLIVSVGTHNYPDALATLSLADRLGVGYVNVHYVSDRGFADAGMVLGAQQWTSLRQRLRGAAFSTPIRFERTFVPPGRSFTCVAHAQEMLMFFPDRRVFTCSMYLHAKDGNAYSWQHGSLVANAAYGYGGEPDTDRHGCPAARLISRPSAETPQRDGLRLGCIFDKEPLTGQPVRSDLTTGISR